MERVCVMARSSQGGAWRRRIVALGLCAAAVGAGCSTREPAMDGPSATNAQEVYGAGVAPDMISTSGFVAPVGQISTGSLVCSGTAVADDAVVTAAHCMCNWSTGQWVGTTGVTFNLPQAGGFNSLVASYSVHPAVQCSPLSKVPLVGVVDLAVLRLTTPIPVNVVQDYPRVHLGPMKADWDSGKLSPFTSTAYGAFVVGWGGTVKYDSAAGGGTRRFGFVSPHPAKDPCDKPVLEGHCNNLFEWESFVNPASWAVTAQGDSGGPLYVTDTATDALVVAGVSSGYYDPALKCCKGCPCEANPPWVRNVWAPTGDVGSIGNHMFLIAALGGDSDKDGLPDAIDNCPLVKNIDQLDEDGDNVGDVCDNCPPSACTGFPPLFATCKNPAQADWDGDGLGDTCDLCPETPKSGGFPQGDDDGDGVGNDCDTCATSSGYSGCSQNGQCAAKNAGFCVFDQPLGPFVLGRCSRPDDSDADQIPDACDTCPGFPNASTLNTNDLAEERERIWNPSVAILADDCDPVPIVRVPVQKPIVMDLISYDNLDTSNGTGPDEAVDIPQERWLGKQTPSEPVGSPLSETWGYRACDCFALDGTPRPLKECVGLSTQCPYGAPVGDPAWTIPTITLTNGTPFLDSNGMTLLPGSFSRGSAQAMTLSWRWRDDVKSGKVPGDGTCGATVQSCKAHVALFTTTQGPDASPRDASAKLRDVFQIVDGPAIKTFLPIPNAFLPTACSFVPCLEWYNPKLYLFDPALDDFSQAFDGPVLLTKVGSTIAALAQPASHDLGGAIAPAVAALVGDPTRMWLTPVEPARRVRSLPQRGGVQAVSFPRDFTSTARIDVVVATRTGLIADRRIDDGGISAAAAAAEPGLRARSDVRAVLSGVEEAVYMVGGREDDGLPSQAIWRYTIADRAWKIVAEHASVAPSSRVLAVTYDEPRGKLYVLDIDDEPLPGNKSRARLASYDVRAGTAEQLATWPFAGVYEQLWLAATEDGSVLLFGAKQQTYKIWRLQAKPAGVKYTGNHTGVGSLLGQPTMGERDPVIAVKTGAGILAYRTLSPGDFSGPQPCSAL